MIKRARTVVHVSLEPRGIEALCRQEADPPRHRMLRKIESYADVTCETCIQALIDRGLLHP